MNSKQENKLTMYKGFIAVLEKFDSFIMGVPSLYASYQNFKTKVSDIEQTTQKQIGKITGITDSKHHAQEKLAAHAAVVANVLMAYASRVGNDELKAYVDYSDWEIMKLRDELVAEVCENIYQRALVHAPDIASGGISSVEIQLLRDLIDTWKSRVDEPNAAKNLRRSHTIALRTHFAEADRILRDEIDTGISIFKVSNPDLYNAQKSARNIIDLGRRHKTIPPDESLACIDGFITDGATSEPLEEVKILIVETGQYAETDEDGEYNLDSIKPGTYTLKVEVEGYETYVLPAFTISAADEISKDILLNKTSGSSPVLPSEESPE